MIEFSSSEFERTFPFYFSFGDDLEVFSCGPKFEKLLGRDPGHVSLHDLFEIRSPKIEFCFEEIANNLNRLFIFGLKEINVSMRGQISRVADGHFYFLGAPWIVDGRSLNEFGLKLDDFALHDPISDFLNVIGAQRVALEETQELTQILRTKQEQLQQARDEAEQADRAKSLFLGNMSHELRTPMNAILGFAQLIEREGGLSERHAESMGRILKSGQYLLDLMDDLLLMSKLESTSDELYPEETDLYKTVFGIWEMCSAQAVTKELSFPFEFHPDLPSVVNVDHRKLKQILLNVLGNAIKFTDAGSVLLKCEPLGEDKIQFIIKDSGIGIEADHLERIFQPFERAGMGRHSYSGAGLGLAISFRFIDLMDGEIDVVSAKGEGTTFRISIPIEVIDTQAHTAVESYICAEPVFDEDVLAADQEECPPSSWVSGMVEAASNFDFSAVEKQLEAIGESYPVLHRSLSKLAADFMYDEIVEKVGASCALPR